MGDFYNTDMPSIFKNEFALGFEFLPKELLFRDNEMQEITSVIKPLLQDRPGVNLFIYGKPGLGKTAVVRFLLKKLEEADLELEPFVLYVNCWKNNTSYKLALEIAHALSFYSVQNKSGSEVLQAVVELLNKKPVVIVLDEVDKLEDFEALYYLLEDVFKKSVIAIANDKSWVVRLEPRLRSRLQPQELEFKPYNKQQVHGILKQRLDLAFIPNAWDLAAFERVVDKTFASGDIRVGLFLMRQAGLIAEYRNASKVLLQDVEKAISKLASFSVNPEEILDDDEKLILSIVTAQPQRIGDLYKVYKEKNGGLSYKSFQRKILKLSKGKYLHLERVHKGGTTTLVSKGLKQGLQRFIDG